MREIRRSVPSADHATTSTSQEPGKSVRRPSPKVLYDSHFNSDTNNHSNGLFSFENSSDFSNIGNDSDRDVDSRTMDSNLFDDDILESMPSSSWPPRCSPRTSLRCRVCNAYYMDTNDLISHYVNSRCGFVFKRSVPDSPPRVEKIRIVTVTELPVLESSSSDLPPEIMSELQQVVEQYLERNGIEYDSESEDDNKKVLSVVLDKLASPDKTPLSHGPAAMKKKNGENPPRKKFKGSNKVEQDLDPCKSIDGADQKPSVCDSTSSDVSPVASKPPSVFKPANHPRLSSEVSPVVVKPSVLNQEDEVLPKKRLGRPKGIAKTAQTAEAKTPVPENCNTMKCTSTTNSKESHKAKGRKTAKASQCERSSPDVSTVDSGDSDDVQQLCDFCDYSTASANDLQNHYGQVHHLSVCRTCNFKVSDPLALESHLKTHMDYYCEQCDQRFYSAPGYDQHLRSHGSGDSFECDICHQRFPSKHQLIIHLRTHMSATRRYFCKHCPRGYLSIPELRKHMSRHQYKSLKCTICNQMCDSHTTMDTHRMTHVIVRDKRDGDGKYECAICRQRFTNLKKTKAHLVLHSDKTSQVEIKTAAAGNSNKKIKVEPK